MRCGEEGLFVSGFAAMLLDGFVGSGEAVVCGVCGRGECGRRRGGTHDVSQSAMMVNWEKGPWDTRLRRRFDFERSTWTGRLLWCSSYPWHTTTMCASASLILLRQRLVIPLRLYRRVVPFRLRPLSITVLGRLTYPRCGALPPALGSLPGACAAYAKNGQAVVCAGPALRMLHASKDAESPPGTFAGGSKCDRRRRRSLFAINVPIGAYCAWMTRTGDSWGGRCGAASLRPSDVGLPHAARRCYCLTKHFQGVFVMSVHWLVFLRC